MSARAQCGIRLGLRAFYEIRPVIDPVAPFEEADRAMRDFKAEKHFGKIVLSIA